MAEDFEEVSPETYNQLVYEFYKDGLDYQSQAEFGRIMTEEFATNEWLGVRRVPPEDIELMWVEEEEEW